MPKNLAKLLPKLTKDEFEWCRALLRKDLGHYVETRSEIMLFEAHKLYERILCQPNVYTNGSRWDLALKSLRAKVRDHIDEKELSISST